MQYLTLFSQVGGQLLADATGTPPAVPDDAPAPDTGSDIAQVGPDEWSEYTDGVQVQVTKLEQYMMGKYSDASGQPGVVVTITVKNGSDAVLDLTVADTSLTYGPNGEAAEWDYSSDHRGFTGSVPPGRSATSMQGFGPVPDEHQDEILIEFAPTWDYSSVFFEGAVT